MNEYGSRRNRKYVFVKHFNIDDINDVNDYGAAIQQLSSLSARMNCVIGEKYVALYVYCRTNTSKVYHKCISLGFQSY